MDNSATDTIVSRRRTADALLQTDTISSADQGLEFEGFGQNTLELLREEIRKWREESWPQTSNATRELLEYWVRDPGDGPVFSLFYAQREAVETVIYLTEVVDNSHWIVQRLRKLAEDWNRGLVRLALRMATGTGKTTVMACLVAWYAVNRRREHRANSKGLARNVDRIVVICPGRTIQDRLQCLNPRKKQNIYDDWRLVPPRLRKRLNGFPVMVLNWEKLQPQKGAAYREIETKSQGGNISKTKAINLAGGNQATESLEDMWSRLLRGVGSKNSERLVVLNDEGHHCWERKSGEKPGVWMEALHALRGHRRFMLTQSIDLSATPIFINPAKTKVPEHTAPLRSSEVVPWVVSEFALMESMEAGLVKIPQPPRGDNTGKESALLNLFEANNGRKLDTTEGMALVRQGAEILYDDYEQTFRAWQDVGDARIGNPVLIAVANNKINARAIFEMLGGRRMEDGIYERSDFPLLSNVPFSGADPSECGMQTILVLSKTNNPEKAEGEEIKGGALGFREIGTQADQASDDELRKVLQTVAQPGKAGAEVRCVVSVGMLTEGWDCQRVTHILGYRKFGSKLLCEQTMGRALRRRDYENLVGVERRDTKQVEQRFPAEYATVFGVPFERQHISGSSLPIGPPAKKHEVYPVLERVEDYRIWVPDFLSYTVSVSGTGVELIHDRVEEVYPVDGQEGPWIEWVNTGGPIGKCRILKRKVGAPRPGAGAWQLAAELVRLLGHHAEVQGEKDSVSRVRRGVLFSECLRTVYEWLDHENVNLSETDLGGDGMRDLAKSAILDALKISDKPVQKAGVPADHRNDHRSAGDWQRFLTGLKDIVELRKSELNVAACHSSLEARIAEKLDRLDCVAAFVRNHGPERIEVPYKYKGGWAKYVPDFFVRCREVQGKAPYIVLEGKGRPDEKSEHKGWWTEQWWIPCANSAGSRLQQVWHRREIGPNDDVEQAIRSAIEEMKQQ